ncbi:hypothetical protein HHK36_002918 [Tetracentron sinense]|uniref:Uncharacterized protein n=1 Tax=Tetracentron sinense TaxID=13715 RepID=A0A834ZN43_TETSI|nr:hypothetical protein HHK36_002918 [Tetracentron sinense]
MGRKSNPTRPTSPHLLPPHEQSRIHDSWKLAYKCKSITEKQRKIMWPKLKSSLTRTGGSRRELGNNVRNKLNLNEEYMEAFRTKSFTEIWSRVQGQLRSKSNERLSSLSPFPSYIHLYDYLLEPRQEILVEMIKSSNLHQLLIDYFQGSLEAFRTCGFLLQTIDQTRDNYCIIQRVIKLTRMVPNCGNYTDDQCRIISGELASFAKLDNPLSNSSPLQFRLLHDRYGLMLDQLTLKRTRVERRAKMVRLCKKTAGLSLVITCGTIVVAMLVLAVHTTVGIVAAPGLVACSLAFFKKRIKSARGKLKTSTLTRYSAQLDAAAKGVYILNRDFDTMSRLVMRLYDEIEHIKIIARMCARSKKKQMLKEVVREFQNHECCFLEQLGELEEHIYLCFLTINRARRLVIQETIIHSQRFEARSRE